MQCCYCIIQYSAIALSPNLIQSSAIHLALSEKRILSIWTIGHTYTRAEWVAGWRKARRGWGGLSVLIQHRHKHLTPPQLIRSAHFITGPHRLELIGWNPSDAEMSIWRGKKHFFSSFSSHSWCNKNVLVLYGILEKLQMVRTQKAVHESHYLNLIQAIFSVSLRLSHLQKNTESGWSKIRTDGNSYGLAGASWRGGNPHMRFD